MTTTGDSRLVEDHYPGGRPGSERWAASERLRIEQYGKWPDLGKHRTPAQIAADQAFMEHSRKLSPRYPSIAEALERRRAQRETIAARVMLYGLVPCGIIGALCGWSMGWAVAGVGVIGFAIICGVAGNRRYEGRQ